MDMITYEFTKNDFSKWQYFYDKSIKLWTVYEVDSEGNQKDGEADYYQNKTQLVEAHGFNFVTDRVYYYIKNDGKYPNELTWLVMSKISGMITSHLNAEDAKHHVDNNNRRWPNGCPKRKSLIGNQKD